MRGLERSARQCSTPCRLHLHRWTDWDGPSGYFFGFVLEELDQQPDLTNQVLEVTVDESGENVDNLSRAREEDTLYI